jgi:hypothetical protein
MAVYVKPIGRLPFLGLKIPQAEARATYTGREK